MWLIALTAAKESSIGDRPLIARKQWPQVRRTLCPSTDGFLFYPPLCVLRQLQAPQMSSYRSTGWIFTFALASAPIMSSSSFPHTAKWTNNNLHPTVDSSHTKVQRSEFTYQIWRLTKCDATVRRLIDSPPKSLPTQAAVGDVGKTHNWHSLVRFTNICCLFSPFVSSPLIRRSSTNRASKPPGCVQLRGRVTPCKRRLAMSRMPSSQFLRSLKEVHFVKKKSSRNSLKKVPFGRNSSDKESFECGDVTTVKMKIYQWQKLWRVNISNNLVFPFVNIFYFNSL